MKNKELFWIKARIALFAIALLFFISLGVSQYYHKDEHDRLINRLKAINDLKEMAAQSFQKALAASDTSYVSAKHAGDSIRGRVEQWNVEYDSIEHLLLTKYK